MEKKGVLSAVNAGREEGLELYGKGEMTWHKAAEACANGIPGGRRWRFLPKGCGGCISISAAGQMADGRRLNSGPRPPREYGVTLSLELLSDHEALVLKQGCTAFLCLMLICSRPNPS